MDESNPFAAIEAEAIQFARQEAAVREEADRVASAVEKLREYHHRYDRAREALCSAADVIRSRKPGPDSTAEAVKAWTREAEHLETTVEIRIPELAECLGSFCERLTESDRLYYSKIDHERFCSHYSTEHLTPEMRRLSYTAARVMFETALTGQACAHLFHKGWRRDEWNAANNPFRDASRYVLALMHSIADRSGPVRRESDPVGQAATVSKPPAAPPPAKTGAPAADLRAIKEPRKRSTKIARACQLKRECPEMSRGEVANRIGCDVSLLTREPYASVEAEMNEKEARDRAKKGAM